ncbi:MAG: hypothetical protein EPO07_17070, partial [Verrucomicrobia bacterium]
MNAKTKLIIPFVCGFILFPGFIVVHECGHWLAGLSFGLKTKPHYAGTSYHGTPQQITQNVHWLLAAAGPLVGLALMIVGVFWLWLSRRHNLTSVTAMEWLATSLAFNAGRWLRGFTGLPSNPQPHDEAFVSKALGLPPWLLPYCLALAALGTIIFIIRQHPARERLFPFSAMMLGGIIG